MPDRRVLIAATGSGCGKTTVTCALLAALSSLGKDVVSFKCGPDYIDPMFHKKAINVESRNLDIFLMGEEGVKYCVSRHAAGKDVAVLEGVMGLYDGLGGGSFASSNHVSLLTNTPVVLALDAKGAALSVCATIEGFLGFEKNNIKGVILNNSSEAMFGFYKEMIEERLDVKVIGFLPHIPEAGIESRHLGLVTADEIKDIGEKIDLLKENALKHIDMEALLSIAGQAEPFDCADKTEGGKTEGRFFFPQEKRTVPLPCLPPPCTIYAAADEAFSFWYEDNHDLLRAMGAEIKFFSPIRDPALPDDADGLLLWGGYPELNAEALEKNTGMKDSLRTALSAGLPCYAECGGFMYLMESLTDLQGRAYDMLGHLPGKAKMTNGLQNFGYYKIIAQKDSFLCEKSGSISAHFFHHSVSDREGDSFKAVKQNGKTFPCIVAENNIFAGYQHLHFYGDPVFAENFVNACIIYRSGRAAK